MGLLSECYTPRGRTKLPWAVLVVHYMINGVHNGIDSVVRKVLFNAGHCLQ